MTMSTLPASSAASVSLLLSGGAEAAHHFDAHGKRGEAALEGFEMLEGEDGGGREDGDLFAVGDGFEGGAHGDFGFAVADVAAEEAVHRSGALHIALDVGDGGVLVGGFFEFEGVFKFALEIAVGREGETFAVLRAAYSARSWSAMSSSDLRTRVLRVFQPVPPSLSSVGCGAFDDAIALDQVHALERDVEASVVGVAEEHEFAAAAVGFDLAEAFELADAVIDVDDEVAGLEFGEIAEEAGGADFAAGAIDGGGDFEEIGVAEERELGVGKSDAFGEGRANEQECRRIRRRASAVKPAAASSDSPST